MENKQIYLWIKEYKEIGLTLYPSTHQYDNIFKEGMIAISTDNQLCFRRIVRFFLICQSDCAKSYVVSLLRWHFHISHRSGNTPCRRVQVLQAGSHSQGKGEAARDDDDAIEGCWKSPRSTHRESGPACDLSASRRRPSPM